jgi:polyphosphate kinase 2 (PPK2 family)
MGAFKNMNRIEKLQAELNEVIEGLNEPVAVVLEGRDTAGKSSTIREVTHYLPMNRFSVQLSKKPSKAVMKNWLGYWRTKMPIGNQIVFYDRSWYSRAMVQHLNQWCTTAQYESFLKTHLSWEKSQNVKMVKIWLSISEGEQQRRIEKRRKSPLTYWKFSENDEKALSYYDTMTDLKEKVIDSGWITIDYDNRKHGIEEFLQELIFALK